MKIFFEIINDSATWKEHYPHKRTGYYQYNGTEWQKKWRRSSSPSVVESSKKEKRGQKKDMPEHNK
jgi:hypothetical protein